MGQVVSDSHDGVWWVKTSFKVSKCCLQPLQWDVGLWDESSVKLFLQELNAVIGAFRFNRSER